MRAWRGNRIRRDRVADFLRSTEPLSREVAYTVSTPQEMDVFSMFFTMACGEFVIVSDRQIDGTLFRATLTGLRVDLAIMLIDFTTEGVGKRTAPARAGGRAQATDVVSAWHELRSALA